MPIYEYECQKCGIRFEKLIRKKTDEDKLICPECASKELEKCISTFASKDGVCNTIAGGR